MGKYSDFITNVCKSLDVVVIGEKDPLVYMVPSEDGLESLPLLTKTNIPYYLPTFENSKNLISLDSSTGEIELTKMIFSPVQEDSIKIETMSFQTLKERISFKLKLGIYELGFLLLNLVLDDKKIKNIGIDLEKFLLDCNKGETRGVKKLVDDDTFTKWRKICTKVPGDSTSQPIIRMMSVRNGKVDKETFKRVTSISFPLGETLHQADRSIDNKINGVALRNKDLSIFDSIFSAICRKLKAPNYLYRVVSNDEDFPAFITLYSLYIDVMSALKTLGSKLEPFAEESFTLFNTELPYNADDISNLVSSFSKEIDMLPTERSLTNPSFHAAKEQHQTQQDTPIVDGGVKVRESTVRKEQPSVSSNPVPPESTTVINNQQPDISSKAAMLFSNRNMFTGSAPVLTASSIAQMQNPASSFISASSGGFYQPPTIGNINPTPNVTYVPVSTGAMTAPAGMAVATPNYNIQTPTTYVDNFGNSYPPAVQVSSYPMTAPNVGSVTPMSVPTTMVTTVPPYPNLSVANYGLTPQPTTYSPTSRSGTNIYRK